MEEGLISLVFLFILLAAGVWIGIALALTGLLSLLVFTSFPAGKIMAVALFNWSDSFVLASLPMFILMGELLYHSKVNRQLYEGLGPWVSRVPGKLLHSNVLACTMFAAISGSSTATLATVGTIAVPELERLGYDKKLMLGSLAGGGTLGLLIPPSISMILYSFLVEESVGQLFMAGVIPGLIVSGLFLGYIGTVSLMRPEVSPVSPQYSWKDRLRGLLGVLPVISLIFLVLGGIYLGWSTPTEAAAMGVGGAIILGLINRALNLRVLKDAITEAICISGMITFIIIGATLFATSIAYLGFSTAVAEFIVTLPVSPYVVLGLVCLLYLALGCLVEGAGMLVLTVPIIHSTMMALGFDSIWFGVFVVIMIEIAQITPPVGINLFVLSDISGQSVNSIVRASIPFFFLLLLGALIITIFPDLALWLPRQMIGP